MFKKLLSGEFGLGETFWKFGIFGVLVVHFFVRIFEFLLQKQIGNLRIVDYYLHYFNPIKFNSWAIFFTLCYIGSVIFFLYYSICVWLGTLRSSANFERSNILKFLSKLLMAAFLAINIWSIL